MKIKRIIEKIRTMQKYPNRRDKKEASKRLNEILQTSANQFRRDERDAEYQAQ